MFYIIQIVNVWLSQQIRNEVEVWEATMTAVFYDFQICNFQMKGNFVYEIIIIASWIKYHSNLKPILI
jgi:hypothetical protein